MRFTITECPLTEVATPLRLHARYRRRASLMAFETLPESTIIESTTMSDARGSKPTCATSIAAFHFAQLDRLDAAGTDVQPDDRFIAAQVQTCVSL